MFAPEALSDMLDQVLSQLMPGPGGGKGSPPGTPGCGDGGGQKKQIQITPAQALVIGGLVTGVLNIKSLLVDKDQAVEIVLAGSLKRKTAADKALDQIGPMPFDEVMKAVADRYG